MSDEKMVTEREAVKRERAAFNAGATWQRAEWSAPFRAIGDAVDLARAEAKHRYPLTIHTSRIAPDPESGFPQTWRVVDDVLCFRPDGRPSEKWVDADFTDIVPFGCLLPTKARIALWADLFENQHDTVAE